MLLAKSRQEMSIRSRFDRSITVIIDHNKYKTRLEERLKQGTGDCFLMRSIRNEEEAESLAVSQCESHSERRIVGRGDQCEQASLLHWDLFRHKISFPETENTE